MRVTFLGTGTSAGVPVPTCTCRVCRSEDPRDRRLRPSVLLEWEGASVLIDTSSDLRQQALERRIARVDAVLYTHAHADHVLGLDDLRVYNWRRGGPIPVYGSADTLAALSRTFWYALDDEESETTRPAIDPRPVEGPFELLGRAVQPVPVLHGRETILGYRIGGLAYLTDVSRIPDPSYELLGNLELLVISALRRRTHATHMNLADALEAARRVGASRTLFTHMSHELPHAATCAELPDGIDLAHDGLAVELD